MSDPTSTPSHIDPDQFEHLLTTWAQQNDDSVDVEAISLVFLLSRLAGQLLGELDVRVHRPRGWSWSGFRIMLAVLVMRQTWSRAHDAIGRHTAMLEAGEDERR